MQTRASVSPAFRPYAPIHLVEHELRVKNFKLDEHDVAPPNVRHSRRKHERDHQDVQNEQPHTDENRELPVEEAGVESGWLGGREFRTVVGEGVGGSSE